MKSNVIVTGSYNYGITSNLTRDLNNLPILPFIDLILWTLPLYQPFALTLLILLPLFQIVY